MEKDNEIVLFETEDKEITLSVPIEQDTVWLTQAQMTELFGRKVSTISRPLPKTGNKRNDHKKRTVGLECLRIN